MKRSRKPGPDFGSIVISALIAAMLVLIPYAVSSCASRAGSVGADSDVVAHGVRPFGGSTPPVLSGEDNSGTWQGKPFDLSAVKPEVENIPVPENADEMIWDALGKAFLIELERAQSNRTASAAAEDDSRRVNDLEFDSATGIFSWSYKNLGDYDLSGEVAIADITAIALNFGKTIEYGGEGNPLGDIETPEALENHRLAWIDGDKNGEIGISDVTPIALNYLNDVTEYAIVSAFSAQTPANEWTEIARVSMPSGAEFPVKFEMELPDAARNIIAVRAVDRDGNMGTMSNFAVIIETETPMIYGIDLPSAITGRFAQFRAAISGTPQLMYEWNFGGGALPASSYSESPTVLFGEPGSYTGALTVLNHAGADTMEFEYTVLGEPYDPPVPVAQAWPITGDAPLEVQFLCVNSYSPNGAIVKYEWDFDGDGTYDYESESPANATHTYEGGVWRARLRVTDVAGRMADAQTDEIIVFPNAKWEMTEILGITGFTIHGAFEDPFTGRPGFAYSKGSPSRVGFAILNEAGNWNTQEFEHSAGGTPEFAGMTQNGTAWFFVTSTGFILECRRDGQIQLIMANSAPGPGTKTLKSATVGPDNTAYALVLATGIAAGNKVFVGRYEFPGFDWEEVPIPNKAATSIMVDQEGRIACASSGNNVWFSVKTESGWVSEIVGVSLSSYNYTESYILPLTDGLGILSQYYPGGSRSNAVSYFERSAGYWKLHSPISPLEEDSWYSGRVLATSSPSKNLLGLVVWLNESRVFRVYMYDGKYWLREAIAVPNAYQREVGGGIWIDEQKRFHMFFVFQMESGEYRRFHFVRQPS